ncbi:HAD hydrolase-like protein [Candidatus Parcubacteria bacterium]|nr:HAD hydrolase-like protein [Patescibacteria group bacterium]MBU4466623.1 HAD hydrolase-like protein [Patescibacteria group bacterium]MCG2688351.1 HAD hydrolase-like protein [Candidatus Parcubacteria bacterium]
MNKNKLVLFDIDGTLIKKGNKKHTLSFSYAFEKVYGIDASIDIIDHSGKSDKQVILEVLKKKGTSEQRIRSKIDEAMKEMAVFYEKNIIGDKLYLLDGVEELLRKLEKNGVLLGLVTANLEPIARAKLKNVNLNDYFKLGGFGGEDENRTNLVKIAIKRAEDNFRFKSDKNIFVVGDTPRDVISGKEAGVRTIAVTTGKYSKEELKVENPDFIFENLTYGKEILKAIVS